MHLADEPAERFDRVTAINLRGVWTCMKHEFAVMREQASGAIVNCSSLGGLVGLPGRASYHATKHGVVGLTKTAALEHAADRIRVNAICPGGVSTPMNEDEPEGGVVPLTPLGRRAHVSEISGAVAYLASDDSSFVTGTELIIDGGYLAR